MKRAARKGRVDVPAKIAHAERARKRDRRMLIRAGLALVVLAPLAYFGVREYERRAVVRLDLSVIGNGRPTVVHVHDFSSTESRQLRDNLSAVEREFSSSVQFRIADLATPDGAILARRHNVTRATLLLFGADGALRETLVGVQEPAAIRSAIAASFPGARRAG